MLLDIYEPGETPLPHEGDRGIAVGIDLGTTNSVVAVARDGTVEVLRDTQGRALLPSVVAYGDDVAVGHDARAALLAIKLRAWGQSRLLGDAPADPLHFYVDKDVVYAEETRRNDSVALHYMNQMRTISYIFNGSRGRGHRSPA